MLPANVQEITFTESANAAPSQSASAAGKGKRSINNAPEVPEFSVTVQDTRLVSVVCECVKLIERIL